MTTPEKLAEIAALEPLEGYEKQVLDLMPNCAFLIAIERVVYGGKPSHHPPITQDQYFALMADLRRVADIIAQLQEAARWRTPDEWNDDVWPKRIEVWDKVLCRVSILNMEHHTEFPSWSYGGWRPLPEPPRAMGVDDEQT